MRVNITPLRASYFLMHAGTTTHAAFDKIYNSTYTLKTMLRFKIVSLAMVWMASLAVLVVTLSDLIAGNPFEKHKFVTGIFFWAITAYIGKAYQHILNLK
jgi:hypothetical protein